MWSDSHRPDPFGRRGRLGAVTLLAVALAGCGSPEEEDIARTALRFIEADAQGRCALLAPPTRESLEKDGASCVDALASVEIASGGSADHVVVAGHSATVTIAGESLFLARYDAGWRVLAAGCTEESDDPAIPLECEIEG